MNHWPFIIAAYGIVIGGSVSLTAWAWTSMRAAERFADEHERVIEAINRFSEIGRPIDGGLRRLNIGRTDYTIIYRLRDDVATILAVAHASRRPGYWRERL